MKRLIVTVALLSAGCGHGCNYSDGTRTGTVVKFSQKGLVCRTFEGELVLGGVRAAEGGAVANVWAFTVEDAKVAAQIQQAADDGRRVKLTYRQGIFTGPCTTESGYFVTAVNAVTGESR